MARRKTVQFGVLDAPPAPMPGIDRDILGKTADDGVYELAEAKTVPLAMVRSDPDQPRKHFDEAKIAELAASIREHGLLDPLKVQYIRDGEYFLLIDGERRLRAAGLAGLARVPVLIRDPDRDQRFVQQLIENLQREDLNDVERGLALARLKTLTGVSWQRVAEMVGLTKRRVLQLERLADAPPELQRDITEGRLTEKHARALAPLPAQTLEAARAVVLEQRVTGDEALALAERLRTEQGDAEALRRRAEEEVAALRAARRIQRETARRPDGAAPAATTTGGPDVNITVDELQAEKRSQRGAAAVAGSTGDVVAALQDVRTRLQAVTVTTLSAEQRDEAMALAGEIAALASALGETLSQSAATTTKRRKR